MPLADLGKQPIAWDCHAWIYTPNGWVYLPEAHDTGADEQEIFEAVQELKGKLLAKYGPWHWFWIGRYKFDELRESEMVRLPW